MGIRRWRRSARLTPFGSERLLIVGHRQTCRYPHFDALLARGCGRQSKAWGGALAEPQYDEDLSPKPAKRATAIDTVSMMMKWRITKSCRPLRGLDMRLHHIPGVAALARSTPGSILSPAPQAENVKEWSEVEEQKFAR